MKTFRRTSWAMYAAGPHGKMKPLNELDDFLEEERQIMAMTASVVRELEANGISCHRPGGDRVVAYHTITDNPTEIDSLRNNNLIPLIQVRKRRTDVVTLEGYCAQYDWGLRMRLLTTGARCRIGEVGQRLGFIHEGVRRLPGRVWFNSVAELISCGIEFTVEVAPDGTLWYHVHAHLIYRILRPIPKAQFREFLRQWKGHFKGAFCPDSGRIRDVREACKYPCKAAELMDVLRGGEMPALFDQLFGRKLFQAYGGHRELRADLTATGEKLKRRRLDAKIPEAVTDPRRPLIEYVRVARQVGARGRYGKRRFPDERPTNIFLGWTLPVIDKVTGQIGVQELWLNPTLPIEELRRLRGIQRWTPAYARHLSGGDEPHLQVHTSISSDRLLDEEDALPVEGEVSPFLGQDGPDADGYPLADLDRDAPADDMGIPTLEGDPDEVFSTICSSAP
jgi:hypothetical protein